MCICNAFSQDTGELQYSDIGLICNHMYVAILLSQTRGLNFNDLVARVYLFQGGLLDGGSKL